MGRAAAAARGLAVSCRGGLSATDDARTSDPICANVTRAIWKPDVNGPTEGLEQRPHAYNDRHSLPKRRAAEAWLDTGLAWLDCWERSFTQPRYSRCRLLVWCRITCDSYRNCRFADEFHDISATDRRTRRGMDACFNDRMATHAGFVKLFFVSNCLLIYSSQPLLSIVHYHEKILIHLHINFRNSFQNVIQYTVNGYWLLPFYHHLNFSYIDLVTSTHPKVYAYTKARLTVFFMFLHSWSEKTWQAKDRLDQQHHTMDWTWRETTARQRTRQRSMENAGS